MTGSSFEVADGRGAGNFMNGHERYGLTAGRQVSLHATGGNGAEAGYLALETGGTCLFGAIAPRSNVP